jgi:hypothetical protein
MDTSSTGTWPPPDEPLEESVVFSHLESAQGGAYRLNRFDEVDLLIMVLPYWLHLVLEFAVAGSSARPIGTLLAMAMAVWVVRNRFPDGLVPLVRVIGMPRKLSSLARDNGRAAAPYPPRRARSGPPEVLAWLATGDGGSPAPAAREPQRRRLVERSRSAP